MSDQLRPEEKVAVRDKLGYPNVTIPHALLYGSPVPIQYVQLVDSNLENLIPEILDKVRQILAIMDRIDCKLGGDAIDNLDFESVGGLKPRSDQVAALNDLYTDWGWKLAEAIGCEPYPYSERYKRRRGTGASWNSRITG